MASERKGKANKLYLNNTKTVVGSNCTSVSGTFNECTVVARAAGRRSVEGPTSRVELQSPSVW